MHKRERISRFDLLAARLRENKKRHPEWVHRAGRETAGLICLCESEATWARPDLVLPISLQCSARHGQKESRP